MITYSTLGGVIMGCGCGDGVCSKCMGGKFIVIGIVVLLTAVYWPLYIWHVLGILLILKGVMKLAMPMGCGHCKTEMPMKKGKK